MSSCVGIVQKPWYFERAVEELLGSHLRSAATCSVVALQVQPSLLSEKHTAFNQKLRSASMNANVGIGGRIPPRAPAYCGRKASGALALGMSSREMGTMAAGR